MKRLFLLLFLALLLVLTACGSAEQSPGSGQSSPPPGRTEEMPEGSVPAGAQPQDVLPGESDPAADYTIERQDRSVYNADGTLSLSWYYDLVQLTGDSQAVQAINESLSGYCDSFFAQDVSNLPMDKAPDDVWCNTMNASVTQNGDRLFSVCLTQSWYMGGVVNSDCLGYTYDLATGEELGLADLTGQDPDTLADTLHQLVKAYMTSHPEVEWFGEAAASVDSRSLEDMLFWVDGGEIVLCFSTYDLSPGAYGPVIIPTGVMVEH